METLTALNEQHEQLITQILKTVLKLDASTEIRQLEADNLEQWDSLAQVNIVAALESQFDIFVETEDAQAMTSFDAICTYIAAEL